jgi:hypothetical protein
MATAVILAITLVYVILQLREAEKLRREQFRPWVTVSFHFRSIITFIAVRNLGSTAARNLRIRFEPELASTLNGGVGEVAMFTETTPVLVPGEERLVLLDRVPDRLESDLPTQHTAYVEYSDHEGRKLPAEEFVLDFGLLGGARLPDKGMHDLVEEVRKAREQLQRG